jgi:hypothetical protein
MAWRDEYPALSGLLEDLRRISGGNGKAAREEPRPAGRFHWPGVGHFWLFGEQQKVVALLAEAYFDCRSPDVAQKTLLRAIGSTHARLEQAFEDSDAWGTLVVPGRTAGTYRLAPLPAAGPEDGE